jgi:hypothetical protein
MDEPLLETLVRMNSDPPPAPPVREDDPLAVDPDAPLEPDPVDPLAVDPVDPPAPLAPPAAPDPPDPPGVRQPVTVIVSFPPARFPALVPCCPDV